jgi:hypothetical protein
MWGERSAAPVRVEPEGATDGLFVCRQVMESARRSSMTGMTRSVAFS